jgi:hypothetical protein
MIVDSKKTHIIVVQEVDERGKPKRGSKSIAVYNLDMNANDLMEKVKEMLRKI